MKKSLIICLLLLFTAMISAQETIPISFDKFVTLNFPTKIEYFQTSITADQNIGIKQVDENLFIQSLNEATPPTNILIKTIDGKFFNYILAPKKNITNLFYKISPNNNIAISEINPNIKDEKKEEKISLSDKRNIVFQKIPYIKNRNIAKENFMKIKLDGVYVDNSKMYFQIEIKNSSNIVYDVENLKISTISAYKEQKNEEKTNIDLIDVFPNKKQISKGVYNFVLTINKYAIRDDKFLVIDLSESKGDRTLSLKISNDHIINARKL